MLMWDVLGGQCKQTLSRTACMPVIFIAPLGRMLFSMLPHYPFYFLFQFFCRSGMKAQGALVLT